MKTKPTIKKDIIALREEWRKLPNYGCFWSSPDNTRGLRLTPKIIPGLASVDMSIEREHSGYPGIAHGGIAYTIIDGLMSWYLMSHEGRAGFTTQTTTTYKGPLKVGKKYSFEVTLDEKAETSQGFVFLIGKAYNADEAGETRQSLVEIRAQFILPNRAIAKKVLGLDLGKHGEDLFPEA
jgi:hypothetical protein